MDIDLTAHIKPELLDEQAQALDHAYTTICRRTMEVMLMEMQGILQRHPEVVYVAFDQEGDTNSIPVFFCLNTEGEDVADMLDDVTSVAERWNESHDPAAIDFMSLMVGKPLQRETLADSRREMCKILAENLPGPDEENKAWAESFLSHLHAIDMEQTIPYSSGPRPAPRI